MSLHEETFQSAGNGIGLLEKPRRGASLGMFQLSPRTEFLVYRRRASRSEGSRALCGRPGSDDGWQETGGIVPVQQLQLQSDLDTIVLSTLQEHVTSM